MSEYSIASPYAVRTRSGDGQMSPADGSCRGIPSKTEQSDVNIAIYGAHGDARQLAAALLASGHAYERDGFVYFRGDGVVTLPSIQSYLSFVVLTLTGFGIAFMFPVVVTFLNVVGVFPSAKMRAWRRGMIVAIAVASAVLTPSQDPFTFMAMALPLYALYEACIVISRLRERAVRLAAPDRRAHRADDGALQAGDRVAGLAVVEDQHGGRARQARGDVRGEAGDPLDPVHADVAAERRGQRDDPRREVFGEPQEIGRRIDRVAFAVPPVGGLDQFENVLLPPSQYLVYLSAGNHREGRCHVTVPFSCRSPSSADPIGRRSPPHRGEHG